MASSSSHNQSAGKVLKRANPSSIHDKFLVGYQGWFTCAGDGEPVGPGHHGWLHWFNQPIPDGGHPNTDLWPDVSDYSPSELFPAPGLKTQSGDPVFLFSSRNAKTVQRHFHWMAQHGVDGAFLQRFVGQCDVEGGQEGIRRIRDEVGDRVREAAEKEGRVFAIMYDVAGVAPERVKAIIEHDWAHLVRNKGVLDSPNYLKEKGKPVVALWGFGFDNAKHTPELVHSITQFFRDTTPGGVYIMAGTPASWRTAEGDADRNPGFLDVWLGDFDAISPWTVGRYSDDEEADRFMETKMKGDVDLITQHNEKGTGRKIDYIPVVLPGGSGYNMSEGNWGFNNIKRRGGRFLWKQIANAKRLGVRTIYGAMWDEYDEGTAFMPVVEHKRNLPHSDKFRFMALDEDGYDVPSDWYMRICGFAAEGLRSERRIHETFPSKELQDYWSSRPKYEEVSQKSGEFISGSVMAGGSGSGSGEGEGQSYEEWLLSQKDDKDDAPPPAYTMIEDEPDVPAPAQPAVPAVSAPAVNVVPARSSSIPQVTVSSVHTNASSPASSQHPSRSNTVSAAGPTTATNIPPQQHPSHQADPIVSLAHDFGRHNISDGGNSASNTADNYYSNTGPPPPPPKDPIHPVSNSSVAAPYPGRPSRPQSLSRPQSQSRPHSQPRPSAPHVTPPLSPHGHQSSYAPPVPPPTNPPQQSSASPQWPPPEWGVSQRPPSSSVPPPGPKPISPTTPTHAHGHGPTGNSAGGANLSRPNSFTASSYSGGGPNLRPTASLHSRPPQQPPAPSNGPAYYSGPNTVASRPTTPYASSNLHPNSNPYSNANDSAFPQPGRYNTPLEPPMSGPGREYDAPYFPNHSATGYSPPMSSYPGQPGPAYPAPAGGSAYPPAHGANYASWGSSPSISSPQNPSGPSTFPGQSSRPYSPVQGSYYTGPAFPPNPSSSAMPNASSQNLEGQDGRYHFPQAPGGPGEGSYYGSSASEMNMPGANASAFPASLYPSQYGSMPPSSAYPSGGGGQSYPQPDPWVPSGVGSGASNIPPRPPTHYSTSQPRPPAASAPTALGYTLNALDKYAGRKTREQLESQIENLGKTGSKLLGKFTR